MASHTQACSHAMYDYSTRELIGTNGFSIGMHRISVRPTEYPAFLYPVPMCPDIRLVKRPPVCGQILSIIFNNGQKLPSMNNLKMQLITVFCKNKI